MKRSILTISRRTLRMMKAIPILGLAFILALVLVAVVNTAMPMQASAVIGQRGTATTATTTNTNLTINRPTGVVAGDVMIVNIAKVGNNTTAPSLAGWTLIDGRSLGGMTHRYGAVLYKVAGASEPASYTFALGPGTNGAVGSIVAFSGVDTSGATPFDVTPRTISVSAGRTTAVSATSITTASANAAVIMFGMTANSNPTWSGWTTTSPGALTELYDNQVGGANQASVGAAWAIKATTGATGAGAARLSFAQRNGGILIALKPAGNPVPTTTSISPTTETVGNADFILTVNGTNFVSGASVVRLDGANRTTIFVSSTQLTATIPDGDLTTAGGKSITVFNPTPGGGTSNAQTLTVNKATPVITWANPADIVYGTALSSTQLCATASVPGTFVYTPDFGALLLAASGQTLHVDFIPDDPANYNTVPQDVTINVSKATLTITADDQGKTYGDTVTFAGTESSTIGLEPGDSVDSVTLTSTGAAADAVVGSYPIVPSNAVGTGLDNYNITYVDGTLTVSTKALTITADNASKTYGDTVTFAGTEFGTIGLEPGDSVDSVTLTSTGAGAGAAVGPYDIVPSAAVGMGLDNYDITYVDGTLTVSTKALTITANDRGKTYGDTVTFAETEFSTIGLEPGDSVDSVTLTSTGAGAGAAVGTYDIVPSTAMGTGLGNYNISYVNGTLTVSVRNITVTADNKGKTYGDADPSLTYQITSGSLTAGDAFTGAIARVAGENVGTYVIQQGTLALNSNYTLNYVGANLTITAKAVTVTADAQSKVYGAADPALTYTFSPALVSGNTFSGALTRAAGEDVGTYAIQQGTLALNSNYNLTFVEGTFTIGPKALTITADSRSKTYGDTGTFLGTEFTTSGLVGSDTVTSVTLTSAGAGASAAVGTYDIVPSAAMGTSLGNYTISYHGGSLTVNKANTSAIVSSLSDPSTSGHSVTFTATVTGTGATGTVTFKDGETLLGSGTLSNGTATYATSTLSVGDHSITAVYDGDANFAGSTSSPVTLTVKAARGVIWGLIAGIIAAGVLVSLFFLLLIFRRRRKPNQQAQK